MYMIKKIFFSLILFSTLFIGQRAFADFQYLKEVEPTNVSVNTYCFKDIDYDEIRSWGAYPDGQGMIIITDTSFQNPSAPYTGGNNMDCSGGYNINLDNFTLSDGNYFLLATTRRPPNYQISDFPDPFKAIYFQFSVSNGDIVYIPPVVNTIGITHSTPVQNATDVNAFATFTGTYDNDGTYNIIYYNIHNYDCTNCEDEVLACSPALIGVGLKYECSFSLATNTHYGITPWLASTTLLTYVPDSEGPYNITTGLVYEVQKPPTSSTCKTFDFGCHLENAISWTFSISPKTLNKFSNLNLENAFPFSYIYDLDNLYNEAFNQQAKNIDISIDFLNGKLTLLSTEKLKAVPFQELVRTIMGAIMIFFSAMFVYRKIININDKNEVIDKG